MGYQLLYWGSPPGSPSPSSTCHVGWVAPVNVRRRQLLRVVGWLHSNRGISHFTRLSLFICSRAYSLHKGAFATSWLLEVPPGARAAMSWLMNPEPIFVVITIFYWACILPTLLLAHPPYVIGVWVCVSAPH